MKVAVRVDASAAMGAGHVVRCLSLADGLRSRGARVSFVSRALPAHLATILESHGHEVLSLDGSAPREAVEDLPHSAWLGTTQAADAADTAHALGGSRYDWLVVDHYALDARWETPLRASAGRIAAIDDLADRSHDCDVLLDQNLYPDMETRYVGKLSDRCRSLLGPRYALVRDEFRQLRQRIVPRSGLVKRVLVFLGGADPENMTGRAIEAIHKVGVDAVDVVVGAENPHREAIEAVCRSRGYDCHVQTMRMAELMAAADLAIGAGGSASWERCCLGLPTASVAFAENHVRIAAALDEVGACVFLGNQFTATQQRMEDALRALVRDRTRLAEISSKAFSLVDGHGSARVRDTLLSQ